MMETKFMTLVGVLGRKYASMVTPGESSSFSLELAGGKSYVFGDGKPEFTVLVNNKDGLAALSTLDATTILESYLEGALDLKGDVLKAFALRYTFKDRHVLSYLWCFLRPLLFGQLSSDKAWISQHYDCDWDFYKLFLDNKRRCYSQGIFVSDSDSLENAITRKLDFAIEATGLTPGQHVLDIGAGWGSFVEHAGRKGIRVTSLTISAESEKFVSDLIARHNLPCQVIRQHLMEYSPDQRFDAIVNAGVTEHLPDYKATLAKYQQLLKPGGCVYLDASAARTMHKVHSFIYRHIFPGNGSYMCLHTYLAQVANSPFRLKAVYDDRNSYYLTTKHWAENLDRNRDEISRRWGQAHYRKFQIYLWGSADAFFRDVLQAYRVVLELP